MAEESKKPDERRRTPLTTNPSESQQAANGAGEGTKVRTVDDDDMVVNIFEQPVEDGDGDGEGDVVETEALFEGREPLSHPAERDGLYDADNIPISYGRSHEATCVLEFAAIDEGMPTSRISSESRLCSFQPSQSRRSSSESE